MNRTRHFVMTAAALVFLGLILARPGSSFTSLEQGDDTIVINQHHAVVEYRYK